MYLHFQGKQQNSSAQDKNNGDSQPLCEKELTEGGYKTPMTHAERQEFVRNSRWGKKILGLPEN